MRTTLIIDDALFRKLKRRAAKQKRTLSQVAQEALRRGLAPVRSTKRRKQVRLPSFALGRPKVDLADRARLSAILDRS